MSLEIALTKSPSQYHDILSLTFRFGFLYLPTMPEAEEHMNSYPIISKASRARWPSEEKHGGDGRGPLFKGEFPTGQSPF